MASSTENKYTWEVTSPGYLDDRDFKDQITAHQIDIDEHEVLRFFEYKDKQGYAVPQLQLIAAFPSGRWMSVREVKESAQD